MNGIFAKWGTLLLNIVIMGLNVTSEQMTKRKQDSLIKEEVRKIVSEELAKLNK